MHCHNKLSHVQFWFWIQIWKNTANIKHGSNTIQFLLISAPSLCDIHAIMMTCPAVRQKCTFRVIIILHLNAKVNANIESSFNTQPIEEADLITEKKLDVQLNERKKSGCLHLIIALYSKLLTSIKALRNGNSRNRSWHGFTADQNARGESLA